YVMQLDQFATSLGRYLLGFPGWLLAALTWLSRSIELAAAPLILLPVLRPHLRRVAILLLTGLHLGIALTMTLGTFPWVMIATFSLLVSARDWERLRTVASRFASLSQRCPPASECEPLGPTRASWAVTVPLACAAAAIALDSYNLNLARWLGTG